MKHTCSAGTAGIVLQPCDRQLLDCTTDALGDVGWSKSAPDPTRADAIRYRLRVFSVAFALAFRRHHLEAMDRLSTPACRFGDMVRYRGIERHYSLPSGHATYSALVVGALWPLIGRRAASALRQVVRRIGRLVTHRSRNALSADVLAGGYLIELHGARRVVDAAGRPLCGTGSPHRLGLSRSGRQCCHDRSARKVRHHPHRLPTVNRSKSRPSSTSSMS